MMKRPRSAASKKRAARRERFMRIFIVIVTLLIVLLFVLSALSMLLRAARAEDAASEVERWVGGAPPPVPQLSVESYALNPEIPFPSDFCVLTVTLRNSQEKPIDEWTRSLDIKGAGGAEGSTETTFTLDAYVKEAYLVERGVTVFNSHSNVGVVGPDRTLTLNFKIRAPDAPGIHMVKFVADVEDTYGNAAKSIHYWIPIVVCEPAVEVVPLSEFLQEGGFLEVEVANCGVSEIRGVVLDVVVEGVQLETSRAFLGDIEAGESKVARFKVRKVFNDGGCDARFNVIFRNGVNTHESDFSLRLNAVGREEDVTEGKMGVLYGGAALKGVLGSLLRLLGGVGR